MLIDWVARLDPAGEFFIDAAIGYIGREQKSRTTERPLEATHRYMRVFVALVTARIMATSKTWKDPSCDAARALVQADLPDAVARCQTVLGRMQREVPYARTQMNRWSKLIGEWLA